MGYLLTGTAQQLTPQNQTQGYAPVNVGALNGQIAQAQGNLGQVNSNQNALAQALLAQSQGQGPNPAQNMLNQATNQNIQQNAGFIASQQGISPALAASQAAQNQGSMSQQAAAQGASMNAQQQLAAQSNLQNLYGQQAGQNLQNIATSGGLANQASLGAQQISGGANAQNAAAEQGTSSGLLGGVGSAIQGIANMFARGGMVQKFDGGGAVGASASQSIAGQILGAAGVPMWGSGVNMNQPGAQKTGNSIGQALGSKMFGMSTGTPTAVAGGPMDAGGAGGAAAAGPAPAAPLEGVAPLAVMAAAHGGKIPAHLQPVAKIYHPNFQAKGTAQLKAAGGDVPGKARVRGDSPKNDTVKTMLSPGEIVLPRSVTQSKDPAQAAADFVSMELAKRGKGNPHADFKMAMKQAIASRRAS